MAALINATTGYPDDVADWADTTPQPGSASSGTTVENPSSLVSFLWPTFQMIDGRYISTGDPRNIYIKSFEDQTAPRLSLTGALATAAFILAAAITFTANLLLQAQVLKRFPALMSAVVAFQALGIKKTGKFRTGALSFSGAVKKRETAILASVLSFVGNLSSLIVVVYHQALSAILSFTGSLTPRKIFRAVLNFSGKVTRVISHKFTSSLSFVGTFGRIKPALLTAAISFVGFFRSGKLYYQLYLASLSFAGKVSRAIRQSVRSILSFLGDLEVRGPRAILMTSILSFVAPTRKTATRSFTAVVRFTGTRISLFYSMFVNVIQYVREAIQGTLHDAIETVAGFLQAEYKSPQLIEPVRAIQTIGTSTQLIDLTDFTAPSPCLFVKNTDETHWVEVDSVNTFTAFPQKIPPTMGVLLSPNTTTIYARAIGAPVDVLLSPAVPPRLLKRRFDAHLPLSGDLPGFPEPLPPITTLYVRFFVMFDQPEWVTSAQQATVIDFFQNAGADTGLLFSVWPDFATPSHWVLGVPGSPGGIEIGYVTYWSQFQIDLKIEVGGGNITVTQTFENTTYDPLTVSGTQLGSFSFGARYDGTVASRYLDTLQMGTGFAGDTNIFAANFNSMTIIPPFESITGPGMSMVSGYLPDGTYSNGSMFITNDGEQTYAVKDLVN